MGLKDHAEEQHGSSSGHDVLHDLGLDLEYLHIEGQADRQAGSATGPPAAEEEQPEGERSSEEVESDAELGSGSKAAAAARRHAARGEGGSAAAAPAKSPHQPLCRAQCVDLGTDGPPEEDPALEPEPDPLEAERTAARRRPSQSRPTSPRRERSSASDPPTPPPPSPCRTAQSDSLPGAAPVDAGKDYQAKLDFCLKLGYSEETVRQVLSKLGPADNTLINDVLGELVKLGTSKPLGGEPAGKPGTDGEQLTTGGSSTPSSAHLSASSSSASSSSCGCSDSLEAGQRSDSPCLPPDAPGDQDNLRPVVIDGSNVAMSHGNKEVFSCHGIQLAVDWFLERGHHDITVFVPAWRKEQSRPDAPITDQELLRALERDKLLVFTPSRRVQGRRVVCYDDRFIVKLAHESDGVIVSNDNYRDLANEKPEWKKFVDDRLLMYSFVNDKFMPPDDPLGRHGPSLDNFLRKRPIMPEHKKQPCPYGKKCTYGHKCKYYHPERQGGQPQRAVADELRARTCGAAAAKHQGDAAATAGLVKSHSVPVGAAAAKAGVPKRQSDPSIRAMSYSEAEDRLMMMAKGRGESHKASICSSSSSAGTSSSGSLSLTTTSLPAPGAPPPGSGLGVPQDQPPSRVTATPRGLLPPTPVGGHDFYRHCEESPPPDPSCYYSVTRPPPPSYPAAVPLSLSSRPPPSHDCRFASAAASEAPSDPRLLLLLGSAAGGSECGSESSASCGSSSSCDSSYGERPCPGCVLPPEPLLEDAGPHYPDPHGSPYTHRRPQSLCYDYADIHHHQAHGLHHDYTHYGYHARDPPPDAPPKQRPPLYPLPPHLQHQPLAARSSCPGDYRSLPPPPDPHPPGLLGGDYHSSLPHQADLPLLPHPPGSAPLGRRCLAPAAARERGESASDSRLYEHRLHRQRHHEALPPGWDPGYYGLGPPPHPARYEPPAYHSLPDACRSAWPAAEAPSWAPQEHRSAHPPPLAYLSHAPGTSRSLPPYPPPGGGGDGGGGARLSVPSRAPPSFVAHHHPHHHHRRSESPASSAAAAHARYGDAREKTYVDLCNIFPPELVGRVMARSPHVADPQRLAAAILAEKAQAGY